jgi:NitT/TauT family transport system substrate-binding protein
MCEITFIIFPMLRHLAWLLAFVPAFAAEPVVLRLGYFPNLTHVTALAARQLEREGQDWTGGRLPEGSKIQWLAYNAGPSAVEALFAGSIDATFIGPSPLLSGHVRTKGKSLRLLLPDAYGGNALVARPGFAPKGPADFKGRRVGTPQLGNTQDIDARAWLASGGLKVTLRGGDAQVIPMANPELLQLFARGQIDAVWTVEPWVTRLTSEFGGTIVHQRDDALITVFAASSKSLERSARKDAVLKVAAAFLALRDRLEADPALKQRLLRAGLAAEFRSDPPSEAFLREALGRIRLAAPSADASARRRDLAEHLTHSLRDAQSAGIIRDVLPVDSLLEDLVDDPSPR